MFLTFMRRLGKRLGLQPSMENRIRELRSFGMVIGEGCVIPDDLEIEEAWASHITFGSEITVARGVRFISHDASRDRGW
ncbi:MAG: hypothetical protein NTV46_00670 [Verrucomicrobia bacterium]|nr:hypothetical protein [Verrucomicrobiota bacterium]